MSQQDNEFSFKSLFVPLTTTKAIHWIICIGLVVFFNGLFNPFQLDDFTQIVNNPVILHLANIPMYFYTAMENARHTTLSIFSIQYRPLIYTIFTITGSSFGINAFPFHLLQLVIHVTNTILVFYLFSLFLNRKVAFLTSLLFLVHPINSESVIYIADLPDVLFVFFGLLACTTLLNSHKPLVSLKRLICISMLLFLSILSKETGILFFILLPTYIVLFSKSNLPRVGLATIAVLPLYFLLRYNASLHAVPLLVASLMQRMPIYARLVYIPQVTLYYFSTFLFPIHLSAVHEWVIKQVTLKNFLVPLIPDFIILMFFTIYGIFLYKKRDKLWMWYVFLGIWTAIGVSMHLQIIPLDVTVADRYFYFPMIGVLGMLGICVTTISKHVKMAPSIVNCFLIIIGSILFLFSLLTIQRNAQWSSQASLYSHDVQFSNGSPILYADYGGLLVANGEFDKAKPYLLDSVSTNPFLGFNINNLAIIYEHEKNYTQAKMLYEKNIHLNTKSPNYVAVSYCGLSRIALLHEKNPTYAKQLSLLGLKENPSDSQLLKFLALSEYQLGDKNQALKTAGILAKIAPNQGVPLRNFISSNKPMPLVDGLYGATYSY